MSTIALDLDGTLLRSKWPALGEWMPGAQDAVRTLMEAGHTCFIYSARLSPHWPDGSERSPGDIYRETTAVRELLDGAGLHGVSIWDGIGKPFWDLLVDDKAIYFPGTERSWKRMVPRILARVGDEDSFTRVMDVANAEE